MKKSIFLTVIAILFAGWVSVYAQTDDTNATPAQPANCTEDSNFPAIGVPHEYEVAISGTTGTATYDGSGTYNWYVTQNAGDLVTETNIVAKVNDYFDVNTETGQSTYHKEGATTKKIGLTWKPDALLNTNKKYFLVLKYEEDNGTCTAMNMKVMKIEPLNQFKLDIDPMDQDMATVIDGDTESATVCAADVDGASYDAGENKVKYTYGENTLYYQVTASGFAGQWKPQISLPALSTTGEQKYVSAQWSPDNGATWKDFTGLTTDGSAQMLTSNDLATIPVAVAGSSPSATYIYKIVVDNEKYETLVDQTLNVATDGTYGGSANDQLKDQKEDCSGDEDAFADKDDYTIKARPTVKATSGGFIQRVE